MHAQISIRLYAYTPHVVLYKALREPLYKALLKLYIRLCLKLTITDALSIILQLLREELEEASWLIRARPRMEPIELCDEEWQPRSHIKIYIIYVICVIYNRVDRAHVPHVQGRFLRSTVVYLKDLSPYFRQFFPYSDFQNIIRVIYQATTPPVVIILLTILYLYTQPIKASTIVLL